MTRLPNENLAGSPQSSGVTPVLLVIAWLWVGVPLAWGISQTVEQSLPLFRTVPAVAAPNPAPH